MLALLWASCSALAQAPDPAPVLVRPGEAMPTRLTLCQREISGLPGERQALMRRCLARRLEGEQLLERNCRRQVAGVAGVAARQQAQRACVQQALAVPSSELPRRPPAQAAKAAPAMAAAAPAPTPRMPAAGEN